MHPEGLQHPFSLKRIDSPRRGSVLPLALMHLICAVRRPAVEPELGGLTCEVWRLHLQRVELPPQDRQQAPPDRPSGLVPVPPLVRHASSESALAVAIRHRTCCSRRRQPTGPALPFLHLTRRAGHTCYRPTYLDTDR